MNIDHDIEEFWPHYCDPLHNGFDCPEFDDEEYEYLAEQSGLGTVPIFMPDRLKRLLVPYGGV